MNWGRSGKVSLRVILLAIAAMGAGRSFAQDDGTNEPDAAHLEEVLVTGEQPGPGLWKVTKGDHVLWMLGTLSPLPKEMTWRSRQVAEIIQHADRVTLGGVDIKPIYSAPLLLRYMGTRKLPNKAALKQSLPADLYARFNALRDRYAPGDKGIEKLRPSEAIKTLYYKALSSEGLSQDDVSNDAVERLAKEHDLDPVKVRVKVESAEMKAWMEEQDEIRLDVEVACAAAQLDWLENSLRDMKLQANAWATGDLTALRTLFDERRKRSDTASAKACFDGTSSMPLSTNMGAKLEAAWRSEVETSLTKHRATLALMDIGHLLDSAGLLASFRSRGYEVHEP